jgi:uncharacterized membrane protein YdjX (TVP38/TMEM64 family)
MLEAPHASTDAAPTPRAAGSRRSWLLLGAFAIGLFAVWRLTPLATLLDRRQLAALGGALAASPAAPVLVVAAFVAGAFVLFPLTPLLAATALVFDPWRAFGLGLAGVLTSAAVGWAGGQLVARHRPRWIESPRFAPLRARLRRRGVLTIALVRLVPAGNFTVVNIVASAIGIRFRDFMIGNGLGVIPGLLLLTLLSHHLRQLGWLS